MVIKEGQFITGRDVLSKQTGIHPSTIDRILNYFENEQQIEKFLDNHPDFTLLPVQQTGAAIPGLPDTGDMLSLSPAVHQTDGFFAAVMQRKAKAKEEPEEETKKAEETTD